VAYGGVIVGNGIPSDRRRLILPAQRPSLVRRKRPHERHTASARHHAPQNRSRHRHGRSRWRFAPAPPPVFLLRADPHGVSRQPAAFLPARGCPRRLVPQGGPRPFANRTGVAQGNCTGPRCGPLRSSGVWSGREDSTPWNRHDQSSRRQPQKGPCEEEGSPSSPRLARKCCHICCQVAREQAVA
jgi:hypothetical protein